MDGTSQKKQRGSEEVWLTAAYEILTEQGIGAVKVMPLAKKLDLTLLHMELHFSICFFIKQ